MNPNEINDFDKKLSLDEDIVRFITVKADKEVNIYTKKIATKVKDLVSDEAGEDVVAEAEAAEPVASEEVNKELN